MVTSHDNEHYGQPKRSDVQPTGHDLGGSPASPLPEGRADGGLVVCRCGILRERDAAPVVAVPEAGERPIEFLGALDFEAEMEPGPTRRSSVRGGRLSAPAVPVGVREVKAILDERPEPDAAGAAASLASWQSVGVQPATEAATSATDRAVPTRPEPAEETDPMDECHNCGCVRDDHAKIGGSWCMNQDAQGPCGCRRFREPPAVQQVEAIERGDMDEPLAEWEEALLREDRWPLADAEVAAARLALRDSASAVVTRFHAIVDRVDFALWDVTIYETDVAQIGFHRINGTRGMARRLARKRLRQARRGYYAQKASRDHFTLEIGGES